MVARFLIRHYLPHDAAPPVVRVMGRLVQLGIAVAVATMLVTVSVVQGFWQSYSNAARQFYSDVVIMQDPERPFDPAILSEITRANSVTPVVAHNTFLYREGLLSGPGGIRGVVLKGVQYDDFVRTHPQLQWQWLGQGPVDLQTAPHLPIILGAQLAEAGVPTHIFMLTPQKPNGEMVAITVVGTFRTGLYDYDHQFALVPLVRLTQLLKLSPQHVGGLEVRLQDSAQLVQAAQLWQTQFPELTVSNWQSLNRNMFDALRLQRTVFALLMALFVLIALSNVVSVVGLQLYFRRSDSQILRVLGISQVQLRRVFWGLGLWTSLQGIIAGTLLGVGLVLTLHYLPWVQLPESVYFVKHLPVALDVTSGFLIVGGTMVAAAIMTAIAVRRLIHAPFVKGLRP